MIVQALNRYQQQRGGYLTDEDLRSVARELCVSLYQIESLVSFYPHYRRTPPPKVEVHLCRDMTCHLRGNSQTLDRLQRWAAQHHPSDVHVAGVSCLGRCDRAPAAMINERLYVMKSAEELAGLAGQWLERPTVGTDGNPLLPDHDSDWSVAQCKIGTWQMECYEQGRGQYEAVRNYLQSPDPSSVLKALEQAGLLGMGGAGGRTYLKWKDVLEARSTNGEKYIVCNADESEPGTFKDRDLLLAAPHLTIEGMILAGLVVGARRGWIYLRHEYPEQAESIARELNRARELGAIGDGIFQTSREFHLELFISPGNYICGEQTALIEAMEDKRAEPRIRPPELNTNGFKNQPTLLNNVETFAWVPAIMLRRGGGWYAEQGRKSGPWVAEQSSVMRGMRFFSVSGDVARPGAYEVPTGIPLGELIDDHCGGMAAGKQLVAVALSGPSGGLLPARIPVQSLKEEFVRKFVPPGITHIDVREIPLDINVSRALDIMIGAGIVVYGTGADVIEEALAMSRFFRNESCGKCVPCRIGSQKITEMGEQLAAGTIASEQLPKLQQDVLQLADVMRATSICGLGQVASQPIRSLLRFFPDRVIQACRARAIDMARSSSPSKGDQP